LIDVVESLMLWSRSKTIDH